MGEPGDGEVEIGQSGGDEQGVVGPLLEADVNLPVTDDHVGVRGAANRIFNTLNGSTEGSQRGHRAVFTNSAGEPLLHAR